MNKLDILMKEHVELNKNKRKLDREIKRTEKEIYKILDILNWRMYKAKNQIKVEIIDKIDSRIDEKQLTIYLKKSEIDNLRIETKEEVLFITTQAERNLLNKKVMD